MKHIQTFYFVFIQEDSCPVVGSIVDDAGYDKIELKYVFSLLCRNADEVVRLIDR
jgi:hypothetical protein